MIITLELNEIELEEPLDVSTSQSTDHRIKIKECIGSKETKHRSSLTHHLKEAYEEQPVSDAESSNIKTEKKNKTFQGLMMMTQKPNQGNKMKTLQTKDLRT